MIIFVDYEHESARSEKWAQRNLAARTWITYRLEDLSGQHCMLVRYDKITPELIKRLDARAIFISGNGSAPDQYKSDALAPLQDIVRTSGMPTFGFCGGFQFFSTALGATVVPLDADPDEVDAPGFGRFPSGAPAELGYFGVEMTAPHAILDGLSELPVFRHAHALHVPEPPAGFDVLGSTAVTPVQIAVDNERRMVGTQFHPEYWTDEHPAGKTLIANFMRWAEIT